MFSRHVVLPPEVAKLLPKNRLLSEVNQPHIKNEIYFDNLLVFSLTASNQVS
jgi:hypothetical protein